MLITCGYLGIYRYIDVYCIEMGYTSIMLNIIILWILGRAEKVILTPQNG